MKSAAYRFVILFGFVSLFSDTTYEGARSIIGPYFATLGASAAVVGVVAGFGEFIGYGLRFLSGYIVDRIGKYWMVAILGYTVNLLAVPLLAFVGRWEFAAFLVVLERLGKAIRTPARDTMLSYATKEIGRGKGFGIHEAMDQIGAFAGPMLITAVFYFEKSYKAGFGVLFVPALIALCLVIAARVAYPSPKEMELKSSVVLRGEKFSSPFLLYLLSISFIAAGYSDFALIAYHFKKMSVINENLIPVFYAVAMGVDALASLIFGILYDRIGIRIIIVSTVVSMFFPIFVFYDSFYFSLFGMVLWGIGMGAQESVIRATVADLVPTEKRGLAYGIFGACYGSSWFIGSALMGFLYDISVTYVIIFSMLAQSFSIPLLTFIGRRK